MQMRDRSAPLWRQPSFGLARYAQPLFLIRKGSCLQRASSTNIHHNHIRCPYFHDDPDQRRFRFLPGLRSSAFKMGDVMVENPATQVLPHRKHMQSSIPNIDSLEGLGTDGSDEYSTLKKLERHME